MFTIFIQNKLKINNKINYKLLDTFVIHMETSLMGDWVPGLPPPLGVNLPSLICSRR